MDLDEAFRKFEIAIENEREQLLILLQNEKKRLTEEREKLEHEKKLWTQFHSKLENIQSNDVIKLNVGGTIFETTVKTLTSQKDTFFDAMFSGRWNVKQQEDGAIFIDRDPSIFRYILNYLRDSNINIKALSETEQTDILNEARFYQLNHLVDEIESHFRVDEFIPGVNYALSQGNTVANKLSGSKWDANVIGKRSISSGVARWSITLLSQSGAGMMVGIVPMNIQTNPNSFMDGYYISTGGSYTQLKLKWYTTPNPITKIDVTFDADNGTLAFVTDGVDRGIEFSGISNQTPWRFCVRMFSIRDVVKLDKSI